MPNQIATVYEPRETVEHTQMPHLARTFKNNPDATVARDLLSEIASRPCAFGPVQTERPLALYGAGNLGRMAREFLTYLDLDFAAVIDRNAEALKSDPAWAGVELFHPDHVPEHIRSHFLTAVSVVTSPYTGVETALRDAGYQHVVPFYDLAESFHDRHPLSNGWFAAPLNEAETQEVSDVLTRWDDDISRAHHLQFLAWRRVREEWIFDQAGVPVHNRFFIDAFKSLFRNDEIFLDVGAHYGPVTETFLATVHGQFRQIIAIEPDDENRARLVEESRRFLPDDPRLTILDNVLGDDVKPAMFHQGLGYASQISERGNKPVILTPIDQLGIKPTLIKLHMEGTELPALLGAEQTIRECRPLLAVTVYHNADGISKTADWLMTHFPDYRFLFRLHSWCGTGAVIYCIPPERLNAATV